MNMIKKTIIYTFVFFFLACLNLFLITKTYAYNIKQLEVDKLLEDITKTKTDYHLADKADDKGFEAVAGIADGRAANLKVFFRKYNSPLYNYAEKIVSVSDQNKFDYRLLPAIAMQESNLCRIIPDNSFNCWGWGIYGTTITRFESYDEAIETVGRGIKDHYIDEGLTTPSQIMEKYTPSSNGSWAHGVNTFLKALE